MSESDIHIPGEALEAARVAWLESASDYNRLDDSIRAACLAMLRAWPGMRDSQHVSFDGRVENAIILPLPAGDANA